MVTAKPVFGAHFSMTGAQETGKNALGFICMATEAVDRHRFQLLVIAGCKVTNQKEKWMATLRSP